MSLFEKMKKFETAIRPLVLDNHSLLEEVADLRQELAEAEGRLAEYDAEKKKLLDKFDGIDEDDIRYIEETIAKEAKPVRRKRFSFQQKIQLLLDTATEENPATFSDLKNSVSKKGYQLISPAMAVENGLITSECLGDQVGTSRAIKLDVLKKFLKKTLETEAK